jgi:glucokinase
MGETFLVGFDLGGTKLLGGLFNSQKKLLGITKARTPSSSKGDEIKNLIIELIRQLLAENKVEAAALAALCVAVPGPLDHKEGLVLDTPNIGFRNYPLRQHLQDAFHCTVLLENDVNAGVYGEFRAGAARGFRNIVGVYPGSGVGGGMVLDGRLYRGARGSAGEVGHMRIQDGGRLCGCGRYGCLETLASKNALARDLVALAATGKAPTILEGAGTDFAAIRSGLIKKSIKAGETEVVNLVKRSAHYLGIGLANCVNLFDPEVVILGGGLMEKLAEEILPVAEKSMREHAMPGMVKNVKVLAATLGDDSVITGCAWLAGESVQAAATEATGA